MSTNKDPLLKASDVLDKLYDPDSMMSLKPSITDGYLVLLGGGRAKKKKKGSGKKDVSLEFMALTQGNVLEACFGVVNPSRKDDTPAYRAAREAKELLDECATTDKIRRTAVGAYCDAFQLIVDYRGEMDRLNCITKCFRAKKIRKKTERNLVAAFSELAKAVGESR
jgi:hypothetical protein